MGCGICGSSFLRAPPLQLLQSTPRGMVFLVFFGGDPRASPLARLFRGGAGRWLEVPGFVRLPLAALFVLSPPPVPCAAAFAYMENAASLSSPFPSPSPPWLGRPVGISS